MTRRWRIGVLALGAVLAACASSGSGTTERQSRPASSSANLLTSDDLARTSAQDVFRAVEIARPNWLRIRGTTSTTGVPDRVQVYLGGSHYGDANALRQVTVTSVSEVRYLDGREATTRYGTGHGAGAILVRLK